jgi:Fungalysin metallopeptidase (M36)
MTTLRIRSFNQIPGASYHTPKELWGFLTPRQRATPRKIAHDVLNANADTLGIDGVMLTAWRHITSLGADHIIFSQRLDDKPIHRAYVTVHLDKQGRVFLIKNRAIPPAFLPSRVSKRFSLTPDRAVALAKRSIRARGATMHAFKPLACWFPRRKHIVPAYRVRIHRQTPTHRKKPTHRSEWIVFIHAETGSVLSKYDNLSAASARARLFDPNPVAYVSVEKLSRKTRSGVRRAATPPEEAYQTVNLRGLSPSGRLDGPRVSTKLTKNRARISGAFDLPSSAPEFEEVMAYYHVDAAMRHVEGLGYRGRWRIFQPENLPIQLNARGTREDNSWYSPGDRTLTFGFGGVDDAEDGETIVHEFGHALQDAICPDFGQSAEAAAMGEGFGDYLAASIFESKKPRPLKTLVMSWDAFEISEETPPRLRTVDSLLTFESFDHSAEADEHENGRIWSATLWDVRRCFTRPRDADRLIVESHFQLDGFTTFARAARAMIDADRNLYKGAHISRLKRVFRRRGIGPVE